jgi:hypothetical protein
LWQVCGDGQRFDSNENRFYLPSAISRFLAAGESIQAGKAVQKQHPTVMAWQACAALSEIASDGQAI